MVILHIQDLKEDSQAKKVWFGVFMFFLFIWPGLANESKKICQKLLIENVNETFMEKRDYKMYVLKACHALNEERLRKEMATEEKCDKIRMESHGRKDYFYSQTPHQTRKCKPPE